SADEAQAGDLDRLPVEHDGVGLRGDRGGCGGRVVVALDEDVGVAGQGPDAAHIGVLGRRALIDAVAAVDDHVDVVLLGHRADDAPRRRIQVQVRDVQYADRVVGRLEGV